MPAILFVAIFVRVRAILFAQHDRKGWLAGRLMGNCITDVSAHDEDEWAPSDDEATRI